MTRRDGTCQRLDLPTDAAILGRAADSTVRVVDRSVSKRHAELQPLPGGTFRLVDLGSSNGVYVDGRRERDVVVRPGQRFRLGTVECVIGGVGEETFPVPESVPRATPDEVIADEAPVAGTGPPIRSARGLFSSRERWIATVIGVGVLAAAAGALWWGRNDSTRKESGSSPRGETSVSASSDASSRASSQGSSRVEDIAVRDSGVPGGATPDVDSATWVGAWRKVGHALDERCADCHAGVGRLRFERSPGPEPGRWEENIRWIRGRLIVSEGALAFAPQSDVESPSLAHTAPIALVAESELDVELESLLARPTRLFAPPPLDANQVALWDRDDALEVRQLFLATRGRVPTLVELEATLVLEPEERLRRAFDEPETWRWRAWLRVRGTGYGAFGPADLPADLGNGADDPAAWAKWVDALVAEPSPGSPPLPTAADLGLDHYRERIRSGVESTDGMRLLSAATVARGRPPTPEESRLLYRALEEADGVPAPPGGRGRALVETARLLFATSACREFRVPSGQERIWARRMIRWGNGTDPVPFHGIDLSSKSTEPIPGAEDREPVSEPDRRHRAGRYIVPPPESRFQASGDSGRPAERVRLDVYCPHDLDRLFDDPERSPRWWSRITRSRVHWFPEERESWSERAAAFIDRAAERGECVILDESFEAPNRRGARVLLSDGTLLPAWRELIDRIGTPRGFPTTAIDEQPTGNPLYQFSAASQGFLTHETTTVRSSAWMRSLATARVILGWRGQPDLSLWFTIDDSPYERSGVWDEFCLSLDTQLAELEVDVWLWYPGDAADTLRALRVTTSPDFDRGLVTHEEQPAARLHPLGRVEALDPGEVSDPSDPGVPPSATEASDLPPSDRGEDEGGNR